MWRAIASLVHSRPRAASGGLWILVAGSHVPGLVSSWRGVIGGGLGFDELRGCVLLTCVTLFCVLKVLDVGFLRFHTDRRSQVAIVLAVALLHLGVVAPGDQIAILPEYGTVVAATLLVISMVHVRRAVVRATQAVLIRFGSSTTSSLGETVWIDQLRPHCWVLASHLFTLRAPPQR